MRLRGGRNFEFLLYLLWSEASVAGQLTGTATPTSTLDWVVTTNREKNEHNKLDVFRQAQSKQTTTSLANDVL